MKKTIISSIIFSLLLIPLVYSIAPGDPCIGEDYTSEPCGGSGTCAGTRDFHCNGEFWEDEGCMPNFDISCTYCHISDYYDESTWEERNSPNYQSCQVQGIYSEGYCYDGDCLGYIDKDSSCHECCKDLPDTLSLGVFPINQNPTPGNVNEYSEVITLTRKSTCVWYDASVDTVTNPNARFKTLYWDSEDNRWEIHTKNCPEPDNCYPIYPDNKENIGLCSPGPSMRYHEAGNYPNVKFDVWGYVADTHTAELCDGIDNNCDNQIDEGYNCLPCETIEGSGINDGFMYGCECIEDEDEDSFIKKGTWEDYDAPNQEKNCLADCDDNPLDDTDVACQELDIDCSDNKYSTCAKCVNPEATEVCDNKDNNCNTYKDYIDEDRDGKKDELSCNVGLITVHGLGGENSENFRFFEDYGDCYKGKFMDITHFSYVSGSIDIIKAAKELNLEIKNTPQFINYKKDNTHGQDIYIIPHSLGHLVTRQAVLLAQGLAETPADATGQADSTLADFYKKHVYVWSLSPLMGGSTSGPSAPFGKYYKVNPSSSYQKWLFSDAMINNFNNGVKGYVSRHVQKDPHLNGVWKAKITGFFAFFTRTWNLNTIFGFMHNVDKYQSKHYIRGKSGSNYEYYFGIPLPNNPSTGQLEKIGESYLNSMNTIYPNLGLDFRYTHVTLLFYPPLIKELFGKILTPLSIEEQSCAFNDAIHTIINSNSNTNSITGNVVVDQTDSCLQEFNTCNSGCSTQIDCSSHTPNTPEMDECLSLNIYCSDTCDFFYDYCQQINSVCSPGDEIFIYNLPYYCDINSEIIPKKIGSESCNNNHECISNECQNNICTDVTIIQDTLIATNQWFDNQIQLVDVFNVIGGY